MGKTHNSHKNPYLWLFLRNQDIFPHSTNCRTQRSSLPFTQGDGIWFTARAKLITRPAYMGF